MIRLIFFLSILLLLIGCETYSQVEITPSSQAVVTQQPNNTFSKEELVGHKNQVWAISWSPDGSIIASGSQDRTIILWDAETGKQLYSLHGHSGRISSLTWFQNSEILVSGATDGKVFLWNIGTGELSNILDGEGTALSPDETILATWLRGTEPPYKDTITLFNVETGQDFCHLGVGWKKPVLNATWSPDNTKLASNLLLSGGIYIWDVQECAPISHEGLGDEAIDSLAWSPDGSTLAAGTYGNPYIGGLVYLWDIQTRELIHTMQGHTGSVINVSWSPDGKFLASSDHHGTIIIWDVDTGQSIHQLSGHFQVDPELGPSSDPPENPSGYIQGVTSVSWSPDGKTLATSGFKNSMPSQHVEAVRLWDVETGELIQVFK